MKVLNKIQRSAGSYYLYLPTKWIKERRIFKGDYMYLETRPDGSMIIRPLEERKSNADSLHTTEQNR